MNRRLKQYVLIFIYTIAICVLTGEITLRVQGNYEVYFDNYNEKYMSAYDNTTMWPRSNYRNISFTTQKSEFKYDNEYNSEGLRDIEHNRSKLKGEYRIMALGDSFTEGFGVVYDDTWCSVLKRTLNKDSTNRVNIINGGFSGSDPFFSYRIFRERLISYNPDLVLLVINGSDIMDVVVRGGNERFLNDSAVIYKPKPKLDYLFSKSHLFRFIIMKIYGYNWFLIGPQERPGRLKEAKNNLAFVMDDFITLTSENSIDFAVIFHPFKKDILGGKYCRNFDFIKSELVKNNIKFYDLLEFYQGKIDADNIYEYYWKEDGHLTPKGNVMFAEGIENFILNSHYLPEKLKSLSNGRLIDN